MFRIFFSLPLSPSLSHITRVWKMQTDKQLIRYTFILDSAIAVHSIIQLN